MKKSLAMISAAVLVAMAQSGHAQDASRDITRFAPLKADELAPAQKAWADRSRCRRATPNWGSPPYRAYIRNPELAPKLSALSDYLRWNYDAAAAPERTRDPDHRAELDRAI